MWICNICWVSKFFTISLESFESIKLENSQCWQDSCPYRSAGSLEPGRVAIPYSSWSLAGVLAPSQHRAMIATAPTRPGEIWNREQYLLQFWELNRCVILLLTLLNIGSGHGAGALRWPVATSCAQHCPCQLQHCNTCCPLSSGWKAPKGPDLASAQSLLRALCFRHCQVLPASASFQHVVFGVTLGTDSSLQGWLVAF